MRAVTVFLLFACTSAAATETGDIIDRLQKSYDSIHSIQAKFTQTYRSARFDERKTEGSVIILKPGKMRWDYSKPKGRVLVSDGEKITLYDPEDRQALVTAQPKEGGLPVAVSFLTGQGRLKEMFKIELVKDRKGLRENEVTLRCEPKKPEPNVSAVFLTVQTDKETLVTATRMTDALGGQSEIRFSGIRVNADIPPKTFAFSPPKGTPIVRTGLHN